MLVDNELRAMCVKGNLLEDYIPANITSVGYDLVANSFHRSPKETELGSVRLLPNESVFVGSKEILNMPDDMSAFLALKNSRIRQGLLLTAPIYQPGHRTRIYFRVTNVSSDEIELNKGDQLAMICFERLTARPDTTYEGTFSDEFEYVGLGEYENTYNKQVKKLSKVKDDLRVLERSIYSNVMVILTVFVAVFSFITTNVNAYLNAISPKTILLVDCSFLAGLSFMVGLLDLYFHEKESRKTYIFIGITLALLLLATYLTIQ